MAGMANGLDLIIIKDQAGILAAGRANGLGLIIIKDQAGI